MNEPRVVTVLLALSMLLLSGCLDRTAASDQGEVTGVSSSPTAVARASTSIVQVPSPTATPQATAIPAPTDTPAPTGTLAPTDTPATLAATSTNTPVATTTPIPSPTPCGPPAGWVVYVIQPGDTLFLLSTRTNTTVEDVKQANCMEGDLVLVGGNLYLPTLPPTPTRAAPQISNTTPDGTIGPGRDIEGQLIGPDPDFLYRAVVYDSRVGTQDGAGVITVTFQVTQNGSPIYERTELHAGYCIFGGGEPDCNPWRVENGDYFWPNGRLVEEGRYEVVIDVITENEEFGETFGNWNFDMFIELP